MHRNIQRIAALISLYRIKDDIKEKYFNYIIIFNYKNILSKYNTHIYIYIFFLLNKSFIADEKWNLINFVL